MQVEVRDEAQNAVRDAAEVMERWIRSGAVKRLMVAGGNTPLPLYAALAQRTIPVNDLEIHVLDEYVGAPDHDPRTCTNLLRRTVAEAWGIPPGRFFGLTSVEAAAEDAIRAHERRIEEGGGLDGIILGLGKNGHLGFNEPGSTKDCAARVLDLDPVSIEANRLWFGGDCAPRRGATVGLRTVLGARHVLLLAFGEAKAMAVHAMIRGERSPSCPASFLQDHADTHIFLDRAAASRLV